MLVCAFFALTIKPSLAIMRVPIMKSTGADKPVELRSMDVRTETVGSLAKTEVQWLFFNPNNRILEGELNFPLMDGQSIASFALEMEDGTLREAVAVDKSKGRIAFDSVTRQKIDPALLEKTDDNHFKLRVYPLRPQKTRRVVVRYTEILQPAKEGYLFRFPLSYANNVDSFSFALRSSGLKSAPIILSNPTGHLFFKEKDGLFQGQSASKNLKATEQSVLALALPLATTKRITTQHFQGNDFFYAELPSSVFGNDVPSEPLPPLKKIAIIWDASGSTSSRHIDQELSLLDMIFKNNRNVTVHLQIIRDVPEPAQVITVLDGNWRDIHRELINARPDGATQFKSISPVPSADVTLLFSDGLVNYQDRGTMLNLPTFKMPVYTVLSSNNGNAAVLKDIAHKTGGNFINLTREDSKHAYTKLFKRFATLSATGEGVSHIELESPILEGQPIRLAGMTNKKNSSVTVRALFPSGQERTTTFQVKQGQNPGNIAAFDWARLRVGALEREYDKNKKEIQEIGKTFSLVTRDTSLIVLDRVEDYALYRITPPKEMLHAYYKLLQPESSVSDLQMQMDAKKNRDEKWQQYQMWWEEDYTKTPKPNEWVKRNFPSSWLKTTFEKDMAFQNGFIRWLNTSEESLNKQKNYPKDLPNSLREELYNRFAMQVGWGKIRMHSAENLGWRTSGNLPVPVMRSPRDGTNFVREKAQTVSKPQMPSAPYVATTYNVESLKKAPDDDVYRVYLALRDENAENAYFYLDAAEIFHERGMKAYALRVLSNLAEIGFEDKQLLRLLAGRLMAYGEYEKAITLYKKILLIAEEEPQSFRDLALAHEANGDYEEATRLFWHVASGTWDRRFPNISEIALIEMNHAISSGKVDAKKMGIPEQYVKAMPLDIRAVLTWDTDLTGVSLLVDRKEGATPWHIVGGKMSTPFREGYGPVVIEMKKSPTDTYFLHVQYSGNRSQFATPYTTATVYVTRHYGKPNESVTRYEVRLDDSKRWQRIPVAEIEIK